MPRFRAVAVVALLVLGFVVGVASPGHAVHGCVLMSPSAGAPDPDNPNVGPDECTFDITPGGAYNVSVAAQEWSVAVTQGTSTTTFDNASHGNVNRVEVVSASAAENGGTVVASVTNGGMVVGCAACEPPA